MAISTKYKKIKGEDLVNKLFSSWRSVLIISALAFSLACLVSFLWLSSQPLSDSPNNVDATMEVVLSGTTTAQAGESNKWKVFIYNFPQDSAMVTWQAVDETFLFQALDTASLKLMEQEVHVYPEGNGFAASLYDSSSWVSGKEGDWLYLAVVNLANVGEQQGVFLKYEGSAWSYAFLPSS